MGNVGLLYRAGTEKLISLLITVSKVAVFVATAGAVFSAFKNHKFLSSISAVVAVMFAVLGWTDVVAMLPEKEQSYKVIDCGKETKTIAEETICEDEGFFDLVEKIGGIFWDLEELMTENEFAAWQVAYSDMVVDLSDSCGLVRRDCEQKITDQLGHMQGAFLAEKRQLEGR